MKLLFDQNLSPDMVDHLRDLFPDSAHVFQVGLSKAADLLIWEFARAKAFVLVSKDADFVELSTLLGFPPKLLWLRLGNCSTKDIEQVLRGNYISISALGDDDARCVLALFSRSTR